MARILIIDDDELLRGVLAKSLTYAGHLVLQAPDGKQGVELARVTEPDLVITDVIMPVQEGVETIIRLRRHRPALPIIAMSGGAANSKLYLEIAAKIGAKQILPKPFSPKDLIAIIDTLLKENPPANRSDAVPDATPKP
jgi:two-component system chemotaxis response regulator CheY